jgi:hypothetical protein
MLPKERQRQWEAYLQHGGRAHYSYVLEDQVIEIIADNMDEVFACYPRPTPFTRQKKMSIFTDPASAWEHPLHVLLRAPLKSTSQATSALRMKTGLREEE